MESIMNKKISTVLIVISVIIIVFGIFAGISLTTGFITVQGPIENIYIDGSDFTSAARAVTSVFSVFIGLLAVGWSVAAVACIWGIYGSVILIVWIIKKYKNKKNA
jgi:hypothetical protein